MKFLRISYLPFCQSVSSFCQCVCFVSFFGTFIFCSIMIESKNVDCVQQWQKINSFFHIFLPLFWHKKTNLWKGRYFRRAKIRDIFCPHATLAFSRVKWKVEDDKRRNPRILRSSALQPIGVFLSSSSKSAASADQRTTVQRQTVPRCAVTLVIWRRKRRP